MKRYFYITIHFFPDYERTIFSKQQDGLYIDDETEVIEAEEEGQEDTIVHKNLNKPFGIALVEIENFLGGYAKR